MDRNDVGSHAVPSSFDLSGDFELRMLAHGAPWKGLTDHLERIRPRAVLGWCPVKFQLDVRIYEIVSGLRIPYLSVQSHNLPLAVELIRQMSINFVVGTRPEALELEKVLGERNIVIPSWHLILAPEEQGAQLPRGHDVVSEVHEFPGMPYGS